MSHRVRQHLRVEIDAYDTTIRHFIRGYDRMISTTAEAVASISPALVLDLGAGTGALSAAALEYDSVGTVVLLDVDPEMLEQGARRLSPFGDRARASLGSFHDSIPKCDAVMASLSLHHIPRLDTKRALFRRIFAAVRPGGVFVNADITMPADDPQRAETYRRWADHLVASGIPEREAWDHFEAWEAEDTYFPLDAELAALAAVGFRARCVWRDEPSTVVVARRPDPSSPRAS